jgi:hypothetical protein
MVSFVNHDMFMQYSGRVSVINPHAVLLEMPNVVTYMRSMKWYELIKITH